MSKKNYKILVWVGGAVLLFFLIWVLFSSSQKTTAVSGGSSSDLTGVLITGLAAGALIMFLFWKLTVAGKNNRVAENSHTVVESIRKVFKVVCAEGQFNELYNFEETKKLFGIIPSTKRALVIIEAKVLMGFDFQKCVWEADENNHTIKLVSFPEPEILSIEPDFKYYNFDEGILNLLNRKDLTLIQENGKKQVIVSARSSHLPKIAAEQMRTILTEVVESKSWKLEGSHKITDASMRPLNTKE